MDRTVHPGSNACKKAPSGDNGGQGRPSVCRCVPDLLSVSLPAVSVLLDADDDTRWRDVTVSPLAPPDDDGLGELCAPRGPGDVGDTLLRFCSDAEWLCRNLADWTIGRVDICKQQSVTCGSICRYIER